MKQTKTQTFKSTIYKVLESYNDLSGKTTVAVFSNDNNTLIVNTATMMVIQNGHILTKDDILENSDIMSDIELFTGITKNQIL